MAMSVLMDTFRDNVAGPAALSQQLLPLIEKSGRKTIAHLTSGLASFGLEFGGKNPSYTISKTALNMLVSPSVSILANRLSQHPRNRCTNKPRNGLTWLCLSSTPAG